MYLIDNKQEEIEKTTEVISLLPDRLWVTGSSTDPESAVSEIVRLKPDLVICEWYMGSINGTALMKTVERAGARCRFIVLTRYESVSALQSFFPEGGLDYLTKPLDLKSLQSALGRYEAKMKRLYKSDSG